MFVGASKTIFPKVTWKYVSLLNYVTWKLANQAIHLSFYKTWKVSHGIILTLFGWTFNSIERLNLVKWFRFWCSILKLWNLLSLGRRLDLQAFACTCCHLSKVAFKRFWQYLIYECGCPNRYSLLDSLIMVPLVPVLPVHKTKSRRDGWWKNICNWKKHWDTPKNKCQKNGEEHDRKNSKRIWEIINYSVEYWRLWRKQRTTQGTLKAKKN